MQINNNLKWILLSLAVAAIGGGVWYSSNVDAAKVPDLKPIGAENQTYDLNPKPSLVANSEAKDRLLDHKKAILSRFKLGADDKIRSFELKTWDGYNVVNEVDGTESLLTAVSGERLVWVAKLSFPDGYDTRIGHYNNAEVTYVIDAENQEVLEKDVSGDLEELVGGPANFEDILKK